VNATLHVDRGRRDLPNEAEVEDTRLRLRFAGAYRSGERRG
jgi:hypothetical protein